MSAVTKPTPRPGAGGKKARIRRAALLSVAPAAVVSLALYVASRPIPTPYRAANVKHDASASVRPVDFRRGVSDTADALPMLAGRHVSVGTFGASAPPPVFDGTLTEGQSPLVQARVRSLLQKSKEEESGTDITRTMIRGARELLPFPEPRILAIRTDGFEDSRGLIKEIPVPLRAAFQGLTVVFLETRQTPRAAAMAEAAGARVRVFGASTRVRLGDLLRDEPPWRGAARGVSYAGAGLSLLLALIAFLLRPVPPPPPPPAPRTRVWVGLQKEDGAAHGREVEVEGDGILLGNGPGADVMLPATLPPMMMRITATGSHTAMVEQFGLEQVTLCSVLETIPANRPIELADGEEILIGEECLLRLVVGKEPSPAFVGLPEFTFDSNDGFDL